MTLDQDIETEIDATLADAPTALTFIADIAAIRSLLSRLREADVEIGVARASADALQRLVWLAEAENERLRAELVGREDEEYAVAPGLETAALEPEES